MENLFGPYATSRYRYDIQGIRAIGAILILVYHIWADKVSGGVDVFFVVSGFLMTGLLLRQQAREGKIRPFHFWGGIIKRVAPTAYLVLLVTLILGYFFLPPLFWRVSLNDLLFSAAHVQNFQLMRWSVDYLAQENPASPFQQFWALSVQVQFYFLLPLLLVPAIFFSRKQQSLLPLLAIVALPLLASFAYSLVSTNDNPITAYFNTGARVWEFLAGAVLAVALPHVTVGGKTASLFSFFGLVLVAGTGIIVPSHWDFPGLVALLPVTGALLLLAAGANATQQSLTNKLLSNRHLVMLGGRSFTVYLWHWPILIYAQHYYSSTSPNLLQGSFVIAVAVFLAFLTTKLVESPFRLIPKNELWASYMVGAVFFVPTVVAGTGARQYVVSLYSYVEKTANNNEARFEGKLIEIQNDATKIGLGQFSSVGSNQAFTIQDCLDGQACKSGDRSAKRVVALVGGSHAAHWEPAFSIIGQQYGFKLVSILQESCAIGYLEWMDEECLEYNDSIVSTLKTLSPDLVITNSTRLDRRDASDQVEFVPQAYVDKWEEITALGIPVLGIRDNPWFEGDPSLCLLDELESASKCARSMAELYLDENPAERYETSIPLFHSVDFVNLFCADGQCPAVFNNRLMYFDSNHFTRTYMEYISTAVMASLEEQAAVLPRQPKAKANTTRKTTGPSTEQAGNKGPPSTGS